jgi:hypothetical protein
MGWTVSGRVGSRDWTVSIGTHRSMEMLPACLPGWDVVEEEDDDDAGVV